MLSENRIHQIRYFELIFQNINNTQTSSMCVLGYEEPTIEEAKIFWQKDCELYKDEHLIEINEISLEYAHESFDMERERDFPIFNRRQEKLLDKGEL